MYLGGEPVCVNCLVLRNPEKSSSPSVGLNIRQPTGLERERRASLRLQVAGSSREG